MIAARSTFTLPSSRTNYKPPSPLVKPRSRDVVRFFFDNLLPISSLSQLERDKTLFPSFSPAIGAPLGRQLAGIDTVAIPFLVPTREAA